MGVLCHKRTNGKNRESHLYLQCRLDLWQQSVNQYVQRRCYFCNESDWSRQRILLYSSLFFTLCNSRIIVYCIRLKILSIRIYSNQSLTNRPINLTYFSYFNIIKVKFCGCNLFLTRCQNSSFESLLCLNHCFAFSPLNNERGSDSDSQSLRNGEHFRNDLGVALVMTMSILFTLTWRRRPALMATSSIVSLNLWSWLNAIQSILHNCTIICVSPCHIVLLGFFDRILHQKYSNL